MVPRVPILIVIAILSGLFFAVSGCKKAMEQWNLLVFRHYQPYTAGER
jgi:hypothetical protein